LYDVILLQGCTYILENSPLRGEISVNVIWGENMRKGREKGGKREEKRAKTKDESEIEVKSVKKWKRWSKAKRVE
jgi:hypothetical protein